MTLIPRKFGFETKKYYNLPTVERGQSKRPEDIPAIEIVELTPDAIWKGIFVELNNLAQARDMPVNHLAPFHNFSIPPEKERNYNVRVNPAFAENGRPTVVVIDLSYKKAHAQQIVLKATWGEQAPEAVEVDPSKIAGAESVIEPEMTGAYALFALGEMVKRAVAKKAQQEQERQEEQQQQDPDQLVQPPFAILMPDSYGSGNN